MLVHNISKGDCKRDPSRASNPCNLPTTAFCQAHHVIPCEVWDDPVATQINCCFDLNGPVNLIMLPCCDFEGRTASYHTGRTPKSTYINRIRMFFDQLRGETDPQKLCAKATNFVMMLTNELCNNKNKLNDETNIKPCSPPPGGTCTVKCS